MIWNKEAFLSKGYPGLDGASLLDPKKETFVTKPCVA